jgi:hypothetical protein
MKKIRFVIAVLLAVAALTTSSPRAEDMPEKCNCWYTQSNQHGMIEQGTCEVIHCAPPTGD